MRKSGMGMEGFYKTGCVGEKRIEAEMFCQVIMIIMILFI